MIRKQFGMRLACLVAAILVVFSPILRGGEVKAKLNESELNFFGLNNILFYDPSGNGRFCSGEVAGSAAKEMIWSGLISIVGLSEEQTAGVMGNMQSESNFNPAQHEISLMQSHQPGFKLDENADVSYGLGLIQWSFGRRVRVYDYVRSKNPALLEYFDNYEKYSPTYLSGDQFIEIAGADAARELIQYELEFLRDELRGSSSYSGIFDQTSVEAAAEYFLVRVEAPQNLNTAQRTQQAQAVYDEFKGASFGASSCIFAAGDISALQEYVLRFAWPDYRGAPFTERMADYAEAVARRQASGQYVGGTVNGAAGIDCGGFVTTLMVESGFDPDYNSYNSSVVLQHKYLEENWTLLNPSGEIDTSILQPGDVAIYADLSHTFVYVGDIPGFNSKIASASYSPSGAEGRAPMAGSENLVSASGGAILWYRMASGV